MSIYTPVNFLILLLRQHGKLKTWYM